MENPNLDSKYIIAPWITKNLKDPNEIEKERKKFDEEKRKKGLITAEEFHNLHQYCPECKSKKYKVTLIGIIDNLDSDYCDKKNIVNCSCGWKGTPEELKSN